MSDAARAKALADYQAKWGQTFSELTAGEAASFKAGWDAAAEQTAAKDAEIARLTTKDVNWANRVFHSEQETAALRAALEEFDRVIDWCHFHRGPNDPWDWQTMRNQVRALLAAPEGQR